MHHSAEEVMKTLQEIAQDMKLDKHLSQVICREDYADYQVVLDGTHHCEIREKIMDVYITDKDKDVLKEIKFRLEHAALYEEWERLDADKRGAGGDNETGSGEIDEDF